MADVNIVDPSVSMPARAGSFPGRQTWVAAGGIALVGAAVTTWVSSSWVGGAVVMLVLSGVVVAWSDVRWRRIPNVAVVVMMLFAFAAAAASNTVSGVSIVAGGVAASVTLLVLHLIDPRWVGFGDVKFACALGCLLGVVWWPGGLSVLLLASIGALVTRPFVAVSWRRSVPFGFWLAVAAVPVSIFSAISVVQ